MLRNNLGMCWRQFMTYSGAEPESWKYLAVAVPIATIAGPTGAFLASYCHRQVLAAFVYILDTVALVKFPTLTGSILNQIHFPLESTYF